MGSFVENSLIPGEKVEMRATITWLSQFWYFVFAIALIMTVIFPVILILFAVINVTSTELAVTNKKIIGKAGFIRRVSIDLPLDKLESVNISQGIIGRIFGFGRITVRGVGGNSVAIPYIKSPMDFRRVVMSLLDRKFVAAA
ncbi:PH domain-containing protein [Ralstonia pseudosolanacearum]|uniref:PH domain-containing protein n=2 Tax=Ralstonia TaxID=48736 RepID=UPI000492E982|nr:PH domain-containing protein [Ralstonia pseudosolanacearum]MDO3523604.1 PH domain-containing protein [Ralstonia pseudosolanacearum]MDO3552966.1 PH domain-containing protein [Ralstonia pseudosolanacearum]MDO3568317.1 PH domain-containing protein [Ralstonia pseudosolanacearum]MDO3592107.1 PH domain-containing protein [Ralstonia pseudosolanacearum]MDO3602380.1 PH domain-containing protein [Ralstonia pseudosolanacearum]